MMCSGAMVSPTTGILNIKAGNVNRNAIMEWLQAALSEWQ